VGNTIDCKALEEERSPYGMDLREVGREMLTRDKQLENAFCKV
jgi:hypothetical protein